MKYDKVGLSAGYLLALLPSKELVFYIVPDDHQSRVLHGGLFFGREIQVPIHPKFSAIWGQDMGFVYQTFQSWREDSEYASLYLNKMEMYLSLFGGLKYHFHSNWYLHYEVSLDLGLRRTVTEYNRLFTKHPDDPLINDKQTSLWPLARLAFRNALFINYVF